MNWLNSTYILSQHQKKMWNMPKVFSIFDTNDVKVKENKAIKWNIYCTLLPITYWMANFKKICTARVWKLSYWNSTLYQIRSNCVLTLCIIYIYSINNHLLGNNFDIHKNMLPKKSSISFWYAVWSCQVHTYVANFKVCFVRTCSW